MKRSKKLVASFILATLLFLGQTNLVYADAASWSYDVGLAETAATPLDLETWGGAALGALAIGTAAYAVNSGAVSYATNYASEVGADAWSWAKTQGSMLASMFTNGVSTYANTAVTLTAAGAAALQTFYNNEMAKLGIGQITVSPGNIITGATSIVLNSVTYTLSLGSPLDTVDDNTMNAYVLNQLGGSVAYVAEVEFSNGTTNMYHIFGSDQPFYFGWTNVGGILYYGAILTVAAHNLFYMSSAASSTFTSWSRGTPGQLTTTGDSVGTSVEGSYTSGYTAYTASPADGFSPNNQTSLAYPANLSSGDTVYLPPVSRTADGDVAVPSAAPLAGSNDIGLTSTGTTATDSTTGAISNTTAGTLDYTGSVSTSWITSLVTPIVVPFQNIFNPITNLITTFNTGWVSGNSLAPVIDLPDVVSSIGLLSNPYIPINFNQWDNLIVELRTWISYFVWALAAVLSIKSILRDFQGV